MNKRLLTYSSYAYLLTYTFTLTSMGACNSSIASEFGLGDRAMGLLLSTHFTGFIISVLLGGYLADRRGFLRPVMIVSSGVLGISLGLFSLSKSVPFLFAAMFLSGIGGGAVEAAVNALISRMFASTRVYSINLLHVYFGVGAFIWPAFAGSLLASGSSWRTVFFIIAIMALAITAVLIPQKFPPDEPAADVAHPVSLFKMFRNPSAILIGLITAFYVGGEMGINAWIVRYFDEVLLKGTVFSKTIDFRFGSTVFATTVTSSIFLTLYWFSITVGRIIATFAGRFFSDTRLLRIMTLSSAIFGTATFVVDNLILATIFLGLTGLFFSGIFATSVAAGGNRFPEQLGLIGGFVIAFSGVGNVIFSAGIGWIAQEAGLRAGMLVAAGMLWLMTMCAFLLKKSPINPQRQEKTSI